MYHASAPSPRLEMMASISSHSVHHDERDIISFSAIHLVNTAHVEPCEPVQSLKTNFPVGSNRYSVKREGRRDALSDGLLKKRGKGVVPEFSITSATQA